MDGVISSPDRVYKWTPRILPSPLCILRSACRGRGEVWERVPDQTLMQTSGASWWLDVSDIEKKKMKLECNASKELKEKGQGDLKSMVKFIPSRGDTKRPPAAERAVKNRLLQSGHLHLSALLWPIMSDESGLSLIFRVNLAPFIKRNKIRRNGWCPFITAPQARHVKWMKKNKGPQTNRWRGKGTAEC